MNIKRVKSITFKYRIVLVKGNMISNQSPSSEPPEVGSASKMNKRDFVFVNVSEQELTKYPGQINNNPFKLSYLSNCTVWLLDLSASIKADNCDECQFFIGPVSGKVELENLENTTINVACKEIKCKNCKK